MCTSLELVHNAYQLQPVLDWRKNAFSEWCVATGEYLDFLPQTNRLVRRDVSLTDKCAPVWVCVWDVSLFKGLVYYPIQIRLVGIIQISPNALAGSYQLLFVCVCTDDCTCQLSLRGNIRVKDRVQNMTQNWVNYNAKWESNMM